MSQVSIIRRDNRERQPSIGLACGIYPTAAEKEALVAEISAAHPDWRPGYCAVRAVVEFLKAPT